MGLEVQLRVCRWYGQTLSLHICTSIISDLSVCRADSAGRYGTTVMRHGLMKYTHRLANLKPVCAASYDTALYMRRKQFNEGESASRIYVCS